MSEINPTTEDIQPVVTDGNTPPATQPQGDPSATDDKTVTLKETDYKELVRQRDRANNAKGDIESTVITLAQEREERAKKETIGEFLENNKDKFPDLTLDDLMSVEDPDDLEEVAKKKQRRYEDVVQEKLLKVQRTSDPLLSPEQKAEKLKELRQNPGSTAFQGMLELQQNS